MTQITGNVTATTLTYESVGDWECIPNGGFETGDLEWEECGSEIWMAYADGTATAEITATVYKSGSKSCKLNSYFVSGDETVVAVQMYDIDCTGATLISYWYNIPESTYSDPDDGVISVIIVDKDTPISYLGYTSVTDGWVYKEIDISEAVYPQEIYVYFQAQCYVPGTIAVFFDDIKVYKSESVLTSATIEDSSKTWTADLLNDGTFILTSGDVQGYSTKILDTFGNYIQVATSFANIINNITSGTSLHTATVQTENPDFSTGDFTGWSSECTTDCTGDEFATIYITSSTKQSGSYAVCGELRAGDPTESTYFTLAPTAVFDVTDITYVSFYYNIINIVRGGDVYFQVSVATAGDGEGNPVIVSETYTAQTDGWLRGLLNVATLTGDAEMTIQGKCPLPDW